MFNSHHVTIVDRRFAQTSFPVVQQPPVGTSDLSHEVKNHLDKTFLGTHSISSLAAYFGTNTSKLMAVFRQAFGKTIFRYLHELKMQHAKSLLSERGYYVTEVAREVGYKNAHHFSAAFKKKYGYNPSTLKSQA